jgi:hypothetical protein
MKNPLFHKHANGFEIPSVGSTHYDGFYPEAVGGSWNPSDGNDLSSTYSVQCGGYFAKDDATQKVRSFIENSYRGTQDIWDKKDDFTGKKKPSNTLPMVRNAKLLKKVAEAQIVEKRDTQGNPFISMTMYNGHEYALRGNKVDEFRKEYAAPLTKGERFDVLKKYINLFQPYGTWHAEEEKQRQQEKEQQEQEQGQKKRNWWNPFLRRKEKPIPVVDEPAEEAEPVAETPVEPQPEQPKQEATTPQSEAPKQAPEKKETKPPIDKDESFDDWFNRVTQKEAPEVAPEPKVEATPAPMPKKRKKEKKPRTMRDRLRFNPRSMEQEQRRRDFGKTQKARPAMYQRRSSLDIPDAVYNFGLERKWQREVTAGKIVRIAGVYTTKQGADTLTQRLVQQVNKVANEESPYSEIDNPVCLCGHEFYDHGHDCDHCECPGFDPKNMREQVAYACERRCFGRVGKKDSYKTSNPAVFSRDNDRDKTRVLSVYFDGDRILKAVYRERKDSDPEVRDGWEGFYSFLSAYGD